jgi:hypothetical protein
MPFCAWHELPNPFRDNSYAGFCTGADANPFGAKDIDSIGSTDRKMT